MEDYNGAGQIGVNDLLLARGVGGGAYGGFGGGFLGSGQGGIVGGANGAYSVGANAVRIEGHAKAHDAGLENLLDQNQFNATNKNIVDGFHRAADTSTNNVNRVADNQFRSELRGSDQLAALTREMAANAKEAALSLASCCCDTQKSIADAAKDAAKCCCDAQLAACKSHAEITATVLSENAKTREMFRGDALATANARIVQLETINALSNRCGNGNNS